MSQPPKPLQKKSNRQLLESARDISSPFNPLGVTSPRTLGEKGNAASKRKQVSATVCILSIQDALAQEQAREDKEAEKRNRRKSFPNFSSWEVTASCWQDASNNDCDTSDEEMKYLMNFSSQNAIEDESTSVSEPSVVEEIKFKRTNNRSGEPEIKKLVLHSSQSTNQIVLSSPRAFANEHSHLDENDLTRKNINVVDMKSSNDSNILSQTPIIPVIELKKQQGNEVPAPVKRARPTLEQHGRKASKSVFSSYQSSTKADELSGLRSPRVFNTVSELLMEVEFGSKEITYDNNNAFLGGNIEGLIRHGVSIGDAKFLGEFVMTLDYWGNVGVVLEKLIDISTVVKNIKFDSKKNPTIPRSWARITKTNTTTSTSTVATTPDPAKVTTDPTSPRGPQRAPSATQNASRANFLGRKPAMTDLASHVQQFISSDDTNNNQHENSLSTSTSTRDPPLSTRGNFLSRDAKRSLPSAQANSTNDLSLGSTSSNMEIDSGYSTEREGLNRSSEQVQGERNLPEPLLPISPRDMMSESQSIRDSAETRESEDGREETKSLAELEIEKEKFEKERIEKMFLERKRKKAQEELEKEQQQQKQLQQQQQQQPQQHQSESDFEEPLKEDSSFEFNDDLKGLKQRKSQERLQQIIKSKERRPSNNTAPHAFSPREAFMGKMKDGGRKPSTANEISKSLSNLFSSGESQPENSTSPRMVGRSATERVSVNDGDFFSDSSLQHSQSVVSGSGRRMLNKKEMSEGSLLSDHAVSRAPMLDRKSSSLGKEKERKIEFSSSVKSGSQEDVLKNEDNQSTNDSLSKKSSSEKVTTKIRSTSLEKLGNKYIKREDKDNVEEPLVFTDLHYTEDEEVPRLLSRTSSRGMFLKSAPDRPMSSNSFPKNEKQESKRFTQPKRGNSVNATQGEPQRSATDTIINQGQPIARNPAPQLPKTESPDLFARNRGSKGTEVLATNSRARADAGPLGNRGSREPKGDSAERKVKESDENRKKLRKSASQNKIYDGQAKKHMSRVYDVELIPEFKDQWADNSHDKTRSRGFLTKSVQNSKDARPATSTPSQSPSSSHPQSMHDFSPEPQQQLNNNIDFDRSTDSVNIIENRIVALISSLIDFNPNYFEDAENLNKLHKLTNMLDSNEKAEALELLKFRSKQNSKVDLFGLLLENQGIIKQSDIKKVNHSVFEKDHFLRLAKPPITYEDIESYFNELVSSGMVVSKTKVESLQSKFSFNITQEEYMQSRIYRFSCTKNPSNMSIMNFKPLNFAKALSYLEFRLFKRVPLYEINYWMKGDKSKRPQAAPYLNMLTEFVNQVTNWVATEIVQTPNAKMRQRVIQQFIDIAYHCLKLNNLDGVLEIVGGLTHNSVERMKLTWNELKESKPKSYALFLQCKDAVAPEDNWKNLRKIITDCSKQNTLYVPYLGLWTKDLTFIHDGPAPIQLNKGQVVWSKQSKMAAILNQIRLLQIYDWPETAVDNDIVNFLLSDLYCLGEKELYLRSKSIEHSNKAT